MWFRKQKIKRKRGRKTSLFIQFHLNSIQLDIDSFQQCRIKSFSAEMMLWHSTFVLAISLIIIRLLNPFEDNFSVVDLICQGWLKQHP